MKWLLAIAVLLVGCASPRDVTPMPSVAPVATSNKQIKEHVVKIRKSNQEAIKTNQTVLENIQAADAELEKLLSR